MRRLRTSLLPFLFAVAAGVFLNAQVSGCDVADACSASNCDGCCTTDGRCDFGNQQSACGSFGATCVTCGPADTCTGGVCVPPPGASRDGGGGGAVDGGDNDAGTTDAGMTDAGMTDAGMMDAGMTDAGTVDAGPPPTTSIAALRQSGVPGQKVRLTNVIVQDVSWTVTSADGSRRAEFWVVDANNGTKGLWIEKFYSDTPTTWTPAIGERLVIDGWFERLPARYDRRGYREALRNDYILGGTAPLEVTVISNQSPPPTPQVQAFAFGDALGGTAKPNPEFAGARVHIAGPLTLTNSGPAALQRFHLGVPQGYNGFEVSGGILVNTVATYNVPGCDWGTMAANGQTVTFPNGISGVWDTYTHAPCIDGSMASTCTRANGYIPGTANDYTYVLYPQNCTQDLAGMVQ